MDVSSSSSFSHDYPVEKSSWSLHSFFLSFTTQGARNLSKKSVNHAKQILERNLMQRQVLSNLHSFFYSFPGVLSPSFGRWVSRGQQREGWDPILHNHPHHDITLKDDLAIHFIDRQVGSDYKNHANLCIMQMTGDTTTTTQGSLVSLTQSYKIPRKDRWKRVMIIKSELKRIQTRVWLHGVHNTLHGNDLSSGHES